jgi:hypothetical protein
MAYAANMIINGRIARRTGGQTEQGLIDFNNGLDLAAQVFDDALASADPFFMLLAEYTFVVQELESGFPEEKLALASYRTARSDFDDAFRAMEVVKDAALYKSAEKTYPRKSEYRYGGYPKDAFHAAYIGHKTRLQNTIKQIGIDPQERKFREKRIQTCPAAQAAYAALQKKSLE